MEEHLDLKLWKSCFDESLKSGHVPVMSCHVPTMSGLPPKRLEFRAP